MIAVLSAMVAPSITQISGGSVEEESSRLQMVMRLALEETQLSAVPLRWVAKKDGWYFEKLVRGEEGTMWQPFAQPPLQNYRLPEGVYIAEVIQAGELVLGVEITQPEDSGEEKKIVGAVLLLPDGTVSQSDIVMSDGEQDIRRILQVRPGPSGIRLQQEGELTLLDQSL